MSREDTSREETPAIDARTLFENATTGVLATIARDDGYPYASVVELIPSDEGDIILLLSDLAEHTQNLTIDPRVSVVVAQEQTDEGVLAMGRATFQGQIERVEDGRTRYRDLYLERHPGASNYVDFEDFAFYRLSVEKVRFIGGFGRMGWMNRDEWMKGSKP